MLMAQGSYLSKANLYPLSFVLVADTYSSSSSREFLGKIKCAEVSQIV